ncbi:MAG: alpha-amylase family glycosyl hydrolase [Prevotellaceae bacterium]|nr:alpha-amylase family glycosyl hydrolase [Prevotellaceae bacterium]MDY3364919.1 alpha-amylase family glycosyl hydrolase [Prevotella sp.]
MKKIYLLLLSLVVSVGAMAQGWPSSYKGVMLQGFYWDGYEDGSWKSLINQADELSEYFDLIWVPQSGYCNTLENQMGYAPIWWFRHDSAFGSETDLRRMIQLYKSKGVGIIEDVVINHRNGNTNWCDFPTETWKGHTMSWTLADICRNDDGGYTRQQGYDVTGGYDEADDFPGFRDLDHTSANVQNNIKLYLDFLLQDLGYAGFRYDLVKGYKPYYTAMYNNHAKPTFSVGEFWDGNYTSVTNWIREGQYTSAAFDFPLQISMKEAFNSGNWGGLANKGIAGDPAMSRYAVTFVDNHDTFREEMHNVHNNILAANAFILALPGTPCLFLKHWQWYKDELKKMIKARKEAGITNESKIIRQEAVPGGYITVVQGTHGKIMVINGFPQNINTDGFETVSVGTSENPNYAFYISKAPESLTYEDGKTFAFFEAPADWGSHINVWAWNDTNGVQTNLYAQWPGVSATQVAVAGNGLAIYKWVYEGTDGKIPTHIIFNNNNGKQTGNMSFVNGGYYVSTSTSPEAVVYPSSLYLNREFTQGKRATVCMPFTILPEEMSKLDGDLYELKNEKDGVLYFGKVNRLEAFRPYMFIPHSSGKKFAPFAYKPMLVGEAKSETAGQYSFSGVLSRKHLVSTGSLTYYGYRESDGTYVKVGATLGAYISGNRAYFSTASGVPAKQMILMEGETTDITRPVQDEAATNRVVYTIDGMRIGEDVNPATLRKGVYVVNGKKVVMGAR